MIVAMRERTPFTRERLARLPDLRLLVTTGMGNASIDMAAAREMGVVVSGTGGLLMPTAELTWGLIISLARHIPAEDRDVREGGWQRTVGTDLHGATLGLVGLGNLGAAREGRPGVRHGAARLEPEPDRRARRGRGGGACREDRVVPARRLRDDHLVFSDRTRGLVGRPELESMKATAYLVNTSRGPIVDESALIEALEARTIAGAGLDASTVSRSPRITRSAVAERRGHAPSRLRHGRHLRRFYTDIVEDIAGFAAGAPVRVLNG